MTYYKKYLKYKEKYLQIKKSENSMKGGYTYINGEYIFFLTESTDVGEGKIEDFDAFTNSLICSWFLRVGKASWPDIQNNYTIIYPNRSSQSAISKFIIKSSDVCDKQFKLSELTSGEISNFETFEKFQNFNNNKLMIQNINSEIEKKITKIVFITKINTIGKSAQINSIYNIKYDNDTNTITSITSIEK